MLGLRNRPRTSAPCVESIGADEEFIGHGLQQVNPSFHVQRFPQLGKCLLFHSWVLLFENYSVIEGSGGASQTAAPRFQFTFFLLVVIDAPALDGFFVFQHSIVRLFHDLDYFLCRFHSFVVCFCKKLGGASAIQGLSPLLVAVGGPHGWRGFECFLYMAKY